MALLLVYNTVVAFLLELLDVCMVQTDSLAHLHHLGETK